MRVYKPKEKKQPLTDFKQYHRPPQDAKKRGISMAAKEYPETGASHQDGCWVARTKKRTQQPPDEDCTSFGERSTPHTPE